MIQIINTEGETEARTEWSGACLRPPRAELNRVLLVAVSVTCDLELVVKSCALLLTLPCHGDNKTTPDRAWPGKGSA